MDGEDAERDNELEELIDPLSSLPTFVIVLRLFLADLHFTRSPLIKPEAAFARRLDGAILFLACLCLCMQANR